MARGTLRAVLFAFFFFHQRPADALYCYSCSASLGNQFKCENMTLNGPAIPYHECFYQDAVCAKYVIEYGDSLMIHRSCHHKNVCAVLSSKYNNFYSNLIDCETCYDSNYCNKSGIVRYAPWTLFALLLIAKLVY